MDNYVSEYGPSVDFLLGSAVALGISTIMTATKYMKEDKNNKTESIVKA